MGVWRGFVGGEGGLWGVKGVCEGVWRGFMGDEGGEGGLWGVGCRGFMWGEEGYGGGWRGFMRGEGGLWGVGWRGGWRRVGGGRWYWLETIFFFFDALRYCFSISSFMLYITLSPFFFHALYIVSPLFYFFCGWSIGVFLPMHSFLLSLFLFVCFVYCCSALLLDIKCWLWC